MYIFELKVDKSASEALEQIEDRGYATPYKSDKRKLFKVGVCISSNTKTVSEWEVVE